MTSVRNLTSLGLALLIAFTSVQFAAARGQPPAVGTMEICTGTGPVHILVDENGEPTGGVMICPDYAMAFFADVWGVVPDPQLVALWRNIWLPGGAISAYSTAPRVAQARGPPKRV